MFVPVHATRNAQSSRSDRARRAETANFVGAICGALDATMMCMDRRVAPAIGDGAGLAHQGQRQGRQNMLFGPLKTMFSNGRIHRYAINAIFCSA